MDLINELKAFVATAETGSFTAAAQKLGISNRLTSKYVAALEDRLGVRLFQRTTRKVGLTTAGFDLLSRASDLVDEIDELLAGVRGDSQGFSGSLRISAPVTLGEKYVVGMLGRFNQAHPQVSFDLRLSDEFSDLASEGIDLAFRGGRTETLSMKVIKLGTSAVFAAASPAYLAINGRPELPQELRVHQCIIDSNRHAPRHWVFSKSSEKDIVRVDGQMTVNSARAACELAINGHGIVYGPKFSLCDALSSGELELLLEDYDGEEIPVCAVYLEGRKLTPKLRALIEFAHEDIHMANVL